MRHASRFVNGLSWVRCLWGATRTTCVLSSRKGSGIVYVYGRQLMRFNEPGHWVVTRLVFCVVAREHGSFLNPRLIRFSRHGVPDIVAARILLKSSADQQDLCA